MMTPTRVYIKPGLLESAYDLFRGEGWDQATHRAMKVASLLRTVCFEEFPVAFLRRHQRTGAAFDAGSCYRVKQVLTLLTKRARAHVVSANRALANWAKGACPRAY